MINPRASSLNDSTTLKITALTKRLRQEGKDIVNFAAGEPDFDTPDFIKEAAIKAIRDGFTKYTPSSGILELREAIARKLKEENQLDVGPEDIIVTAGAKYAIFAALFALVSEGEEVIIPSPYWVSYPEMVKLTGGTIRFLETREDNNFKIEVSDLKKVISKNTRVLVLNYPNNPTGVTYTYEELKQIYDIIKDKKNITVISDEIYEALTYDGKKHVSFGAFNGAGDCTVTINGFSKTFSMTGWRMGYLVASRQIINTVSKIIDHTTSCPSSVSQKAAQAALSDRSWQIKAKNEFEKRRDLLWGELSQCRKLKPVKPEGTFYMFCDIAKTGLSSFEFSTKLLEEQLVSCIPADAFGKEGFIRLSFATSMERISKGIDRIKAFIKEA